MKYKELSDKSLKHGINVIELMIANEVFVVFKDIDSDTYELLCNNVKKIYLKTDIDIETIVNIFYELVVVQKLCINNITKKYVLDSIC